MRYLDMRIDEAPAGIVANKRLDNELKRAMHEQRELSKVSDEVDLVNSLSLGAGLRQSRIEMVLGVAFVVLTIVQLSTGNLPAQVHESFEKCWSALVAKDGESSAWDNPLQGYAWGLAALLCSAYAVYRLVRLIRRRVAERSRKEEASNTPETAQISAAALLVTGMSLVVVLGVSVYVKADLYSLVLAGLVAVQARFWDRLVEYCAERRRRMESMKSRLYPIMEDDTEVQIRKFFEALRVSDPQRSPS